MLKREWKTIFKHNFFVIVMIALAFVPAIYDFVFLGSLWDPYGKLNDLPVAVVNLDKSSTLSGKTLELGKSVTNEMKKTKDLDYHFVSKKTADDGLSSGKYYMKITFPENFSSNAASLMTGTPKSVQLDYQTTSGHNYISSKMSESAMNTLQAEVSNNITQEYTRAIFSQLSEMKSGMNQAADGSARLADGSASAKAGSQALADNLATMAGSSLTFNNGLQQYTGGVQQVASGSQQLTDNAKQLSDGLAQLTKLSQASDQLQKASQQLSDGLSQLTAATAISPEQKTELANLETQLSAFGSGMPDASLSQDLTTQLQSVGAIITGLGQKQAAAVSALPDLTDAQKQEVLGTLQAATASDLQTLQGNLGQVQTDLEKLSSAQQGLSQAAAQLPVLNNTLSTLSNGIDQAHSALANQLLPGAGKITSGMTSLNQAIGEGSTKLQSGFGQFNNGLLQVNTGAQQLSAKSGTLNNGAQALSQASGQLAAGGQSLNTGLMDLTKGNSQLSSQLGAADKQLSSTKADKANADFVAQPIKLKHKDTDNVPKNGVGMAPYMISVALFIGALATNVVIGTGFSGRQHWKSGREYMQAKIGTNGLIAVLQGLIAFGAVYALGLRANHPWEMLGAILLISLAFMAFVTFILTWLGKIGEFISIVLLVLQLATSAGTYPLELSSKFFQILSPFLPMTYGLRMLRETIGLSGDILVEAILFAVMIVVFTLMLKLFTRESRFS